MNKNISIACIILDISSCILFASEKPQSKEKRIISKIVTNQAGKAYLEVDGKPVLYNSVQAWLSEDWDYDHSAKNRKHVNELIYYDTFVA